MGFSATMKLSSVAICILAAIVPNVSAEADVDCYSGRKTGLFSRRVLLPWGLIFPKESCIYKCFEKVKFVTDGPKRVEAAKDISNCGYDIIENVYPSISFGDDTCKAAGVMRYTFAVKAFEKVKESRIRRATLKFQTKDANFDKSKWAQGSGVCAMTNYNVKYDWDTKAAKKCEAIKKPVYSNRAMLEQDEATHYSLETAIDLQAPSMEFVKNQGSNKKLLVTYEHSDAGCSSAFEVSNDPATAPRMVVQLFEGKTTKSWFSSAQSATVMPVMLVLALGASLF